MTTVMVSHEGRLHERDVGSETVGGAGATRRFDPGPGWRPVEPD